jgi:hypothetical protein
MQVSELKKEITDEGLFLFLPQFHEKKVGRKRKGTSK